MYNEILFLSESVVLVVCAALSARHSYGALVAWTSVQMMLATLCSFKEIVLCGATVTGGEIFIVSSMCAFSFAQERFGVNAARRMIRLVGLSQVLFLFCSVLHVLYVPAGCEDISQALAFLLVPTPRLIIASLVAYVISERIHSALLAATRSSLIALVGGQFVDTFVCAYGGLAGVVHHVAHVFWVSFGIKIGMIIWIMPLMAALKKRVVGSADE